MQSRSLETVAVLIALTAVGSRPADGMEARSWTTELDGSGQESSEAAMVAAGRWVRDRLPDGRLVVDPHRTGEGVGDAVVEGVARALGASLGTLEETRRCEDVMDPSTCTLDAAALIAIAPPSLDGDRGTVRVYAWFASDSPREPVGKRTWDLELRRDAGGWRVVSGR